ncbi:hypothetical protein [Streptomyces sp. SID9727]|nr:hypothetical protein [Streptomyces sp. SID9727]
MRTSRGVSVASTVNASRRIPSDRLSVDRRLIDEHSSAEALTT